MSHPCPAWHRTTCIRHCTHCIFVITTSPQISHPLLNDITPTFSVTSYALYITSDSILKLSHYSTYAITTSIYETISSIHETSQPLSVSAQPLYRQQHTHSLYDITLEICVASFALYKTSHPQFMTSNQRVYVITPTIFDIVYTVSVLSHPLYWWYHSNCIYEIISAIIHKIIYIVYEMKASVWHHNDCIDDIKFPTYDITSRVYVISNPIPVTSQTLCLWIHVSYI